MNNKLTEKQFELITIVLEKLKTRNIKILQEYVQSLDMDTQCTNSKSLKIYDGLGSTKLHLFVCNILNNTNRADFHALDKKKYQVFEICFNKDNLETIEVEEVSWVPMFTLDQAIECATCLLIEKLRIFDPTYENSIRDDIGNFKIILNGESTHDLTLILIRERPFKGIVLNNMVSFNPDNIVVY